MADPTQKSPKTLTRKLIFAWVAFVICILVAEGALRAAAWFLVESRSQKPATDEQALVHCYGDSWTYGLGVAPQAAYPAVLEQALDQANFGPVRVVNRGVPGAGIEKVGELVRTDLAAKRPPDVVLIWVGVNDRPAFSKRVARNSPRDQQKENPFETLATYRVLRHLVLSFRRQVTPSMDRADTGLDGPYFEDRLTALVADVKAQGSVPIVLGYPLPVDPVRPQELVRNGLDVLKIAKRRAADRAQVSFVDLQPTFDRHTGDGPWLPIFMTHPNEQGYAMIAAALAPVVAQALGKKAPDAIAFESLPGRVDSEKAQWPAGSLKDKKEVAYSLAVDDQGNSVIEADTSGDGSMDYRTVLKNGRMIIHSFRPWGSSNFETTHYRNGERTFSETQNEQGGKTIVWYEQYDPYTLFEFLLFDKDANGVFDHYEQTVNGLLVTRLDDNDQDGRYETFGLIDPQGDVVMQIGDLDQDGRRDYWEVRADEKRVFHSSDGDGDGLVDRPLPPFWKLNLDNHAPNILSNWCGQTQQETKDGGQTLTRSTNRGPDGARRDNLFVDGELVFMRTLYPDGAVSGFWGEIDEQGNRLVFLAGDKNRDGQFDHYEEHVNDRLARRQDDNNQDGIWEVWALIDETGAPYMHLGDIDQDGAVDYWELLHNEHKVFSANDGDRDGLPDKPLPPLDRLGINDPNSNILLHWDKARAPYGAAPGH